MAVQSHRRHLGDTEVVLAATLQRPDETAVDLTGLTVKFKMVSAEDGTEKIAATATGISVTDASAGECQYQFSAAGVDTEGTYYGYFTVTDGSGHVDTFPAETGDLEIIIMPDQ